MQSTTQSPKSVFQFSTTATAARATTSQVTGHWWIENAWGWHLGDYHIAASWTWDDVKVADPSSWSWGDGHWGYQYCDEDARGERWVNPEHTQWQTFGRGKFGPTTLCANIYSAGGTLNVDQHGQGWLS